MALITTYATLQSAIADYLGRTDLTDAIKTFIQLAEADIRRNLRSRKIVAPFTISTSDTANLPDAAKDVHMIRFDTDTYKYPLKVTTIENLATLRRSGSGRPNAYAIADGVVYWDITPDTSYDAQIAYIEELTALSDSNTSNHTLLFSPDIYLFGALKEAEPYLEHDERNPMWSAKYQKAVADENDARERAEISGGPVVMRLPISFG